MANYVSTPGNKKRRLVEEREDALRRCMRRKAPQDECAEAAELLRATAIAYYESIGRPDGRKPTAWRERSLQSILSEYGRRLESSAQQSLGAGERRSGTPGSRSTTVARDAGGS